MRMYSPPYRAQNDVQQLARLERNLSGLRVVFCLVVGVVFCPLSELAAQTARNSALHTAAAVPSKQRISQPPQQSPFVRLGLSILSDSFAFNTFNDFGSNAFDPTILDRVLVTRETRWAFGRIETAPFYPSLPQKENTPSKVKAIGVRPLNVASRAWHPFFGNIGTPWPFAGSSEAVFDSSDLAADPLLRQPTTPTALGWEDSGSNFTVGANRSPFAYRYAMDKKTSLNAGVAWIHDLSDTTGMAQALEEPGNDSSGKASGVNVSLGARYKAVTLTGGYIRALDPRSPVEFALDSKENDPVAWNSELAYSTELLRRETTLTIGYLKASDGLHYVLPEERYSTKASMALSNSTTLSLEYYQDREFTLGNGEEDEYGITTRIGVDF